MGPLKLENLAGGIVVPTLGEVYAVTPFLACFGAWGNTHKCVFYLVDEVLWVRIVDNGAFEYPTHWGRYRVDDF